MPVGKLEISICGAENMGLVSITTKVATDTKS